MDDGNSWIGIVLFAASVILFAVMYGFGAAVQALNTSALEDERDEGNKRAEKLLKIQEDPYLFIRTNQLATSILTLAMGASSLAFVVKKLTALIGTHTQIPHPAAVGIAYIAGLVGIAFLLTGLGIVIPKRIAAKSPIRFCYKVLPLVELVTKCLFPFAWLMDQFAYISLKAVGIDIREKDDNVTEEDIMYMVNEGHEQGVLEASEAEMITNIFEFDDKVAADIMTHRTAVIALDGEMTLKEALDFVVKEANYSRFPVYSEDIDNIIGILHMRDMLHYTDSKDHLNTPIAKIKGLLRSPHFIPETKNINALFKEMQSQKIHIELVVDEYGQLAGIVTMEDILEEIVGNILDEYDKEEPDIVSRKNGTYELTGLTLLDDVEETLGVEFDKEDKDNFDTLNGFMVSRIGHIPKVGEKGSVRIGDYLLKIMKVENKVIQTVLASPLPKEKSGTEAKNGNEMNEKTDRKK